MFQSIGLSFVKNTTNLVAGSGVTALSVGIGTCVAGPIGAVVGSTVGLVSSFFIAKKTDQLYEDILDLPRSEEEFLMK